MSLEWVLLGLRLLSTIILYSFLGLAFYLIWADLKQAHRRRAAEWQGTDQLRVISATGDTSLAVGEVFPLQPVTYLGQAPDNTVVLPDASIAAHHARLVRKNGVWWLEELDDQGDTLLNDRHLAQPTALAQGDVIRIGNLCFRLETAPPAAA